MVVSHVRRVVAMSRSLVEGSGGLALASSAQLELTVGSATADVDAAEVRFEKRRRAAHLSEPRGVGSDGGVMKPRMSIALVGTYPPTECGIATFTSNLAISIATPDSGWSAAVVRVMDQADLRPHDRRVVETWRRDDRRSLERSLAVLNRRDVVVLQHEYGIFGGVDGQDVLQLVEGLTVPLIVVLHTALVDPSRHQREILEKVIELSAQVVVQSEAARSRIATVHGMDIGTIVVIPHGAVGNFGPRPTSTVSPPTVLTWGLLSPGKGIEHGIRAVARLWPSDPSLMYVVAGETHPKVRSAQGEYYRDSLRALAIELGAEGRVRFDGEYRDWDSLRALIRSVDVVLLPYESREQVSSGVLVEALASGKSVVATTFPHAEELLAGGAGILVDQGDVNAMAEAISRILNEPGLAARMSSRAREVAEPLLWSAVGESYRKLIERVVNQRLTV